MPGPFRSSRTAIAALAVLLLLSGCVSSRTPIPSEPQRTTEADGRKARMEREAADLKTSQAAAAKATAAKEAAAKQAAAQAAKQAEEAQPKSAEAAAPAVEKVETAGAMAQSAETPTTEAPKAEPAKVKVVKVEPTKPEATAPAAQPAVTTAEAAPSGDPLAKTDAPAPAPAKTDPATAEAAPKAHLYYVQMGSFTSDKNAEGAVAWLRANGFDSSRVVKVEQSGAAGTAPTTLHRVQAGPFQDLDAAHKALDGLKINWPQAFIPGD